MWFISCTQISWPFQLLPPVPEFRMSKYLGMLCFSFLKLLSLGKFYPPNSPGPIMLLVQLVKREMLLKSLTVPGFL